MTNVLFLMVNSLQGGDTFCLHEGGDMRMNLVFKGQGDKHVNVCCIR